MPSLKERPPNHEGGPPSFSQDARSDLQEPVSSDHDIEHGGPGQTRDKPLRVRYQPRDRGALIETVRLHPENMRQADALELIIVAAIVASRVDPLRWISYSRRHDWWTNARRYMPRSCTHATVVRGVDLLAAQGLLEHDRKRPGNLGWQSRFRATNALINLIEKALPSLVWVPAETILLKDEAKRLIGYPDTPDTLDLRRRLIPINEMLDATPVDLADGAPILSKSIEVIRIAPNHAVYLRGRRLHRVFNDGVFSLGGRMYGHWVQSLPKSLRADLILDGEPTFELDYGQTHPRMLAAEMGINLGAGDIYAIDGWPRQQIKIATNIAINAKTYDSAIRAITREIGGRGARKQAEACLDAVKAQHPQLAGAFGTGAGLRLQRADADIAEAIITRLMNRGVSILPIHDSFVIAQQYEGILREAMEAAWRDFLGTDPIITPNA